MIKAIYVAREDGDYDFVMAVDEEKLEMISCNYTADAILADYATGLEEEGEVVKFAEFGGASEVVDVLEDDCCKDWNAEAG